LAGPCTNSKEENFTLILLGIIISYWKQKSGGKVLDVLDVLDVAAPSLLYGQPVPHVASFSTQHD